MLSRHERHATLSHRAARTDVVAAALELFERQGFEATSVEQIAQAAGVSRSDLLPPVRRKEDVVFADHEVLLDDCANGSPAVTGIPGWPCARHPSASSVTSPPIPSVARRRYRVVRQVPALREREIVTVFRYERLFDEYLRGAVPGLDPLDAVGFAALVTAVHNHVLRQLLRGKRVRAAVLRTALDDVCAATASPRGGTQAADDDVVVAVFPKRMPRAEVSRRLHGPPRLTAKITRFARYFTRCRLPRRLYGHAMSTVESPLPTPAPSPAPWFTQDADAAVAALGHRPRTRPERRPKPPAGSLSTVRTPSPPRSRRRSGRSRSASSPIR